MKIGSLGVLIGLICTLEGNAQDYQAVKGSSYAGALTVSDNPASILSTPYPWDLTIFSANLKNTTNAVTIERLSYLSHSRTIPYKWTEGDLDRRYAAVNFNVHLLNLRLDLGRKQAISFGMNLRGYANARTGKFNYSDTLLNMNQFFNINQHTNFQGDLVSSSWLELYGTYSKTLWDDEKGRLNGGVTLKAQRGISGIYAQLNGGSVSRAIVQDSFVVYTVASGNAKYGYSQNYDTWHSDQSTGKNLNDFLTHTQGGASIDIGFEYLVKPQYVETFGGPDSYYEYSWKFGASLLDLGGNVYVYGSQSRSVGSPNDKATDAELNYKFDNSGTLAQFNDSLYTIVDRMSTPRGRFHIYNPARFNLNVDRMLPEHFAINADLTLNLGGNNKGTLLFNKDITLLALTPRWETEWLGGYLPIEVTTDGHVWVGGAFKAGPLLLGVHNWADVFSKDRTQNGGFYLALTIHPVKGWKIREDKKYTCPKN
jgi:hypothetical protein